MYLSYGLAAIFTGLLGYLVQADHTTKAVSVVHKATRLLNTKAKNGKSEKKNDESVSMIVHIISLCRRFVPSSTGFENTTDFSTTQHAQK